MVYSFAVLGTRNPSIPYGNPKQLGVFTTLDTSEMTLGYRKHLTLFRFLEHMHLKNRAVSDCGALESECYATGFGTGHFAGLVREELDEVLIGTGRAKGVTDRPTGLDSLSGPPVALAKFLAFATLYLHAECLLRKLSIGRAKHKL